MLGFLKNIFYKVDEELFDNLEESLILADCSAETAMELVDELRDFAKENKVQDGEEIKRHFRRQIEKILTHNIEEEENKKAAYLIIGVNGSGKTTSIGKLANFFQRQGKSVLLSAADTFRAAATEQLEIWAERANCPIVKAEQGADPSAVVFDSVKAAISRDIDIVLIDTAGRLHNKKDLMDELGKIRKTIDKASDGELAVQTLLVLDGSTGQNALSQAKAFGEVSEIDGIVLTKLDSSSKGGAVISIAHEQKIPVSFVGTGESLSDIRKFDAEWFVNEIFN